MAAEKQKEFTHVILRDEKGNKYTLEFNSRVVKRMQRNNFKLDLDYPNVMIEELVIGAFQMHHRGMRPEEIMDVWNYQRKKDDLLGILVQLYNKPLEDLMSEKKDNENEDPTWETA